MMKYFLLLNSSDTIGDLIFSI